MPNPANVFVEYDGDTHWLYHYQSADDDKPCPESPIRQVEAGDSLADLLAAVDRHTCQRETSDAN